MARRRALAALERVPDSRSAHQPHAAAPHPRAPAIRSRRPGHAFPGARARCADRGAGRGRVHAVHRAGRGASRRASARAAGRVWTRRHRTHGTGWPPFMADPVVTALGNGRYLVDVGGARHMAYGVRQGQARLGVRGRRGRRGRIATATPAPLRRIEDDTRAVGAHARARAVHHGRAGSAGRERRRAGDARSHEDGAARTRAARRHRDRCFVPDWAHGQRRATVWWSWSRDTDAALRPPRASRRQSPRPPISTTWSRTSSARGPPRSPCAGRPPKTSATARSTCRWTANRWGCCGTASRVTREIHAGTARAARAQHAVSTRAAVHGWRGRPRALPGGQQVRLGHLFAAGAAGRIPGRRSDLSEPDARARRARGGHA